MKIRFLLSACLGTVLVFGATSALARDNDAKPASKKKPAAQKPALPTIKKGMTGEEIIKIVGRPLKIEPMKTPEGQEAEVWIYSRLVETKTRSVQTGVTIVPAYDGTLNSGTTVTRPVWGMEHDTIYQFTRLLMFEGKLVASTQTREVSTMRDN